MGVLLELRQSDGFSGPDGFVCGKDQLDGIARFASWNHGRAFFMDCPDKVSNEDPVAFETDGARIARAAYDRTALHGADGFVLGSLVVELPSGDPVVLEYGGAFVSTQLNAHCETGLASGRGFNCAKGATGIAEGDDRSVLYFDPFVSQTSGVGKDLTWHSHQPLKEIDDVDSLIHESPAPIEQECPSPGNGVVIRLFTPPLELRAREGDCSETSIAGRFLHRLSANS